MKKKTSKSKKSSARRGAKVERAPRMKKANEVSSDTSLQSSLTSDVGVAPSLNDTSARAGQAGDVQGITNMAEADPESVAELLEEGQALEAEVVSGVEDAPDEREVPSRGRREDEPLHSYDERNKI